MVYAGLVTEEQELLLTTNTGYALRFMVNEIPVTGLRTGGVKGISLKDEAHLTIVTPLAPGAEQDIVIVTHRGAVKRMNVAEIDLLARAKRGHLIVKEVKSNPHRIFAIMVVHVSDEILLETEKGVQEHIQIVNLSRADRFSIGNPKIDIEGDGALIRASIVKK